MALLWSAHPELRNQIDASRTALNSAAHFISSTQCGAAGPPNNVFGWGRVDILAAVGSVNPITLQARVKGQATNHKVQLKWNPADGGQVSITRNASSIGNTPDDGNATDKLGTQTGSFTYQVCETDSGDCSNEVTVVVP